MFVILERQTASSLPRMIGPFQRANAYDRKARDVVRGHFFALDAKTGKMLWLGQAREATNTALVKAGELLFLLNDDAEPIVARVNRTGFEPLRRYIVAESATWAQPTITGNRLFVKDVSTLALWMVN